MTNTYTAQDLVNLIRKHYVVNDTAYNRHVILEQVPDGTGMFQNRWVDVAVFSMFPSKGLTRFAFEVKVSRTDFLNELSHPEKHQWCKECFHEFWFVAPKEVIQIEELPANIGWMYPTAKGLSRARHAVRNPNPRLDDKLLAGFMRAAGKEIELSYKASKEDILKNDSGYQQARLYEQAVVSFCQSHGDNSFFHDLTKEQILEHLEKATMDKQVSQDKEQILSLTAKFQREILNLLPLFVTIAKRSLIARDELGKHIISVYGGSDDLSIDELQKYMNDKKAYESQKRIGKLIATLLSEPFSPDNGNKPSDKDSSTSSMDIQEIFNKDDVLSSVEELTKLVVDHFDNLDVLVLMWETNDGRIYHRNYGTSTDIVGLLAKGQYIILRQTIGDTTNPHEEQEV